MPSSIFFLKLLQLNVYASDEDPLDLTFTKRNLYSALTRTCRTGEKKSLYVLLIFIPRFLWLLHDDMFPIYCPESVGDIPSSSELLLHLFAVFSIGRACQTLFLEFSKDGPTDLGDKFIDGGLAKQPVVLQGHVGFSCCQVSHGYYQFQPYL